MQSLPRHLKKVINFFESLPGIGPKTAKRLGFYILRIPQSDLEDFASSINLIKKNTLFCQICMNISEDPLCPICQDSQRDTSTVAVVESVLDLLSMEAGDKYKGVYHVLHGRIDPLNLIGPDDIYISALIKRVGDKKNVKEIILATNTDTEGEATAMFIKNRLEELKKQSGQDFKITRLAYGLPIGANLEYADYMTLERAVSGRQDF